jgi:hypothetical protein
LLVASTFITGKQKIRGMNLHESSRNTSLVTAFFAWKENIKETREPPAVE